MNDYARRKEAVALREAAEERALWVDMSALLDLVTQKYPGQTQSPLDRLRLCKTTEETDVKKQLRYLRGFLDGLTTSEKPAVFMVEVPSATCLVGPRKPVVWISPDRNASRFHAGRVLELMQVKARKR